MSGSTIPGPLPSLRFIVDDMADGAPPGQREIPCTRITAIGQNGYGGEEGVVVWHAAADPAEFARALRGLANKIDARWDSTSKLDADELRTLYTSRKKP